MATITTTVEAANAPIGTVVLLPAFWSEREGEPDRLVAQKHEDERWWIAADLSEWFGNDDIRGDILH